MERVNRRLGGNVMSAAMQTQNITALTALPAIPTATDRARPAWYLATTTPDDAVEPPAT